MRKGGKRTRGIDRGRQGADAQSQDAMINEGSMELSDGRFGDVCGEEEKAGEKNEEEEK